MKHERPNIVLITSDDHGQWASNCYGCDEIHTPVLDYLAETGIRMDRAFTPSPVCSPARASLYTGKLPSQHGIHDYLSVYEFEKAGGAIKRPIPEYHGPRSQTNLYQEITLPEILQTAGYRCALSGKWHMGDGHIPNPGFSRWFSVPSPQGGHSGSQYYSDEGTVVQIDGFKSEVITDRALLYLDDFARDDSDGAPFFLNVNYIGTHAPWSGHPERLVSKYRAAEFSSIPLEPIHPWTHVLYQNLGNKEAMAQYYAGVTHIDENIGRLLDRLETLGLREHTLVVYTADHGLACGHHGIWGKGNCTSPKNMYEASIRVPLIANHPHCIPAGQTTDEIISHCDTFLTLLEWTGVPLPEDERVANLPGMSYAHILKGERNEDESVYFGEYGATRCIRTSTYKYVHRYELENKSELFQISHDPGERYNLIDDPRFVEVKANLLKRLETYFSQYEVPERSGLRMGHGFHGIAADGTPLPG